MFFQLGACLERAEARRIARGRFPPPSRGRAASFKLLPDTAQATCAFRQVDVLAGLPRDFWRFLVEKSRSKRLSKTNEMLSPFRYCFLNVLAPFWKAKMLPKSNKFKKNARPELYLFRHRFSHRIWIVVDSENGPPDREHSLNFIAFTISKRF